VARRQLIGRNSLRLQTSAARRCLEKHRIGMRSVLAARCSEMRRQQGSLKGCPASAGYKCDRGAKHGVIGCSTEILAIILNHS
jgi:hypothetical protein